MTARYFLFVLALLSGISAVAQKKKRTEPIKDPSEEINVLLTKHGCNACHHSVKRVVGPPFSEIAKRNYLHEAIVEKISNPEPKNWPGYPAMPALTQVPNEDALKIAAWINSMSPNKNEGDTKLR